MSEDKQQCLLRKCLHQLLLEHGGETPPGSATILWVGDAGGFRTWLTTEAGTGSVAEVRPL